MTNMKQNVIHRMIRYGIIEEEDAEVYSYGLSVLTMYGCVLLFTIIISFQMGCFLEGLFFLISYKLLRSSTGGYHAKSATRCIFASVFVFICALLCIKNWHADAYIVFLCTVISVVVVFAFSPLADKNKPLSEIEYSYNKKKAQIIIIVESIIIVAGYYMYPAISVAVLVGVLCCALLLVTGYLKARLLIRK